jgi:hypothetical protein
MTVLGTLVKSICVLVDEIELGAADGCYRSIGDRSSVD